MPDTQQVLHALRRIVEPNQGQDIVSLGLVKDVQVSQELVTVTLELGKHYLASKDQLEQQARAAIGEIPGAPEVKIRTNIKVGMSAAPEAQPAPAPLSGVRYLVAVASGKGGVGKSTVAANLALALQRRGAATGLMDADIYGPSMPIMLGSQEPPKAQGQSIIPIEAHGLKIMSMGLLAGRDDAVIWRGPMVHNVVTQFLNNVQWGELDYLVIDMPPGTGDAQLTITQTAPLSGAVIVTTPQQVALDDVRRGVRMFEKVNVPIVGVVENMSFFECPSCHHREEIFAHGGGKDAAKQFGVPFLGEIPIDSAVRRTSDAGLPIVAAEPDSNAARAFEAVARSVSTFLAQLEKQKSQKPKIKFS